VRTEIQKELDRVEEYILNKLFGDIQNPKINLKIQTIMAIKGIDFDSFINEKIERFESFMKDFMREDGFLDGEKLEKVVCIHCPILEGLKLPSARPIEYVKLFESFIPLEKIAQIIEKM
jgi:hypothetical protein